MNAGVTVALIVLNEQENIGRVLAALEAPPFAWEILIIDNGSTDGTFDVVRLFQNEHPSVPLRWMSHSPNNLGAARAQAVKEAKYHVIAFLDADCTPPSHWAEKGTMALLHYESDTSVLGLGSGNYPPPEGDSFNQALAIELSSSLGHLNTAQARLLASAAQVNHLPSCNVFYFRERLLSIGNFSPAFGQVCEDLELNWRAISQGYKLIYEPGLEVVHSQRPSFLRWAAKMFRYGWGQIEVARRFPRHLCGAKALPLLAVILALCWVIVSPVSFVFFSLFYLAVTGIYSVAISLLRGKPRLSAQVFFLFVITHSFYSAGEFWGLLRQIKRGKVHQGEGKQARLLL